MTNGFKLFFHPLLRDRKWSLWNRNDKRWNSFLLHFSIGVKSWPPYLDNRAGAKLREKERRRRMDISCVSDTDKWPPSRYTFTTGGWGDFPNCQELLYTLIVRLKKLEIKSAKSNDKKMQNSQKKKKTYHNPPNKYFVTTTRLLGSVE